MRRLHAFMFNLLFVGLAFCYSCGGDEPRSFEYVDAFVRFYEGPGFNSCGFVLEVPNGNGFTVYSPNNIPTVLQVDDLPVRVDFVPLGFFRTCNLGLAIGDLEEVHVYSMLSR